ncbi:hypothetical protein J5N97_009183 [Dioscorea zingiberensis]|uniref:SNARE-complex protein Syntaxin-18 N-terminal domain-containing protein n=1 Tax=Dioscorea zingiberensis TaxID=325984 RepID=A0A9D5HLJ7_9LILI|nr:hypothetical protein J5N97_009183 [Dioscorea zingiberensis]
MSRSRDRTEDFKDAVRAAALSSGYTESKLAAILASFIMHKAPDRKPLTRAALKTLSSINELEHFIVKHRKDYVGFHRTTEHQRDDIEHEVSIFIKSCKDQIDFLKNGIHEEEKNRTARKWLHTRDDGSNADVIAHKHGVVLILSERLHAVTALFDRLRSVRFQDAVNKAMPRRKMHKIGNLKSSEAHPSDASEITEHDLSSGPLRTQDQLLDDETRALQVELTSLLDAVQETETKMVEMSALNHLMSTHVLQQAQQIEQLYEQAVAATMNVERGNKELSQAIQRNNSSKTFLILFMVVLTFSILFLDWYS